MPLPQQKHFGDAPPGKDVIDVVQQQRFSDEKQQVSLLHQRPSIGLIDYKIKAADGSLRMYLLQCGLKINKMYMSL